MPELFSRDPAGFAWASGIEDTFIPQVRPGMRSLDEYELTQHYQLWKTDFDLLAESGIRVVRWGIPWYHVQPAPEEWDWRWVDEALDYLVQEKGITPILDLMHYGTPLWLENSFINSGYPERVAEYAAAVAERYGSLIRYYTPFNEPGVAASWCGSIGVWPPYLQGEDGYVKVLLAAAQGIVKTVQALKTVQEEAVIVQVEAFGHLQAATPDLEEWVALSNQKQYLGFDLITGKVNETHALRGYLRKHGVSDETLGWFTEHCVGVDILGVNFYPWSYGKVVMRKNGLFRRLTRKVNGQTIGEILSNAYTRYQLPVAVTETSALGDVAGRAGWMDETIAAIHRLRQEGIPVVGYTWFPFFSMVSWFYRTGRRPLREYLIHLGLVDASFDAAGVLQRERTPLVSHYRDHQQQPMPVIGVHV